MRLKSLTGLSVATMLTLLSTACGGSSESDREWAPEKDVIEPAYTIPTTAPTTDDDMQQVVEVDDQVVLSDFNPRCIIERVSQAGSLWFTVELTNELEKDHQFEVSVNAFYDGEFKGNRTFNSREIEAGKRGRDESFLQNVDDRDKRKWTCQVESLTAN